MESTLLSTIIARMQRWQTVLPTEEQYLVYDLDEAIRTIRRDHKLPWTLQKGSLKVFDKILEYPLPTGYDSLAILEGREKTFEEKPQPYYTSIKEFYEDPLNTSAVAEIWDNGVRYLGVRNNNLSGNKTVVDQIDATVTNYTASDDATALEKDTIYFNDASSSIKVTIVNSADTATVEHTPIALSDSNYKRKYYFRKVFFTSLPTNVTLKFGTDSSNYLSATVTTQFSGQAFKIDDWNILAFDLNEATETGTQTSTFAYEAITATGLDSGFMYLDQSSLSEWKLMDLWYYSNKMVKTLGNSAANQEFFMDTNLVYSTDSEIVCPATFVDVFMYEAMITTITDRENNKLFTVIDEKRTKAWASLLNNFPDMEPLIQTNYWRTGGSDNSPLSQTEFYEN
jgi:hypothetical protein